MGIFWQPEKWLIVTVARSPLETHHSYKAMELAETWLALELTLTMLANEVATLGEGWGGR
jgi:hypothetical protein